jgi:hypothetical protein
MDILCQMKPNLWGQLLLPLCVMPLARPNSSPSVVRFNLDEPNLRSFGEFTLKVSPLLVGHADSIKLRLLLQIFSKGSAT